MYSWICMSYDTNYCMVKIFQFDFTSMTAKVDCSKLLIRDPKDNEFI